MDLIHFRRDYRITDWSRISYHASHSVRECQVRFQELKRIDKLLRPFPNRKDDKPEKQQLRRSNRIAKRKNANEADVVQEDPQQPKRKYNKGE